jgi:hypothetical protein
MGATRLRVNGKIGVSHYIDHAQSTDCTATNGFICAALKPYPKLDDDKEWFKLRERWNKANPKPESERK